MRGSRYLNDFDDMIDFWFTLMGILVAIVIVVSLMLKPWKRESSDRIVQYYEGIIIVGISILSLWLFLDFDNFQWLFSTTPLSQYINALIALVFICSLSIFPVLRKNFRKHFSKVNLQMEKEVERQRIILFPKLFPRLSRIPLFGRAIRWIYKEGWIFSFGFLFLFGVAIVLRFWNLGVDLFYHDEIQQYQTVLGLIHKGELGIYNPITDSIIAPYYRGAILTKMAFYFVKVFGESVFVIRFPVALAGCLLIVAFYLGLKKLFNKPVALLGVFLLTFNPYLIYFARFFRDYSLLTFFFCIATMAVGLIIVKSSKNGFPFKGWPANVAIALGAFYLSQKFGNPQTLLLLFISLLSILILFAKPLWRFYRKHFWVTTAIILFILILFFSNRLPFVNYRGVSHMFRTLLTPRFFSSEYSMYYLNYLFSFNFKWIFIVFSAVLFLYSIFCKRAIFTYLTFVVWIGYYVIAYLGDRYEDFRYISFLIPIAIILVAYILNFLWQFSKIFKDHVLGYLMRLIVILLIILTPTYQLGFDLKVATLKIHKAQAFWVVNEGNSYIHRRAVAPEYKKVFDYLNFVVNDEDIVIFYGAEYVYLKNYNGKDAYYFPRNSKTARYVADIGQNVVREVSFDDLLNTEKKIWFVGTYIHLMDPDIVQILFQEPFDNIGEKLGIKKYNYNDWYVKMPTTWPTIVRRRP